MTDSEVEPGSAESSYPGDAPTVAADGEEVQLRGISLLTGHDGEINVVAWGQLDGQPVLASGGNDPTVRIWDIRNGSTAELTGHTDSVRDLAWGELNGQPVLVSAAFDNTLRVWDVAAAEPIGAPMRGDFLGFIAVAWGKLNGQPVLASGSSDGAVRLWNPATGELLGTPISVPGGLSPLDSLAWGELNGRPVLASGGTDGAVRLWNLATGELLGEPLTGHSGFVTALAWGELDGRTVLASSSRDGTLRLWNPTNSKPLGIPITLRGPITALAWSELDGRPLMATGSVDGPVAVWELVKQRFTPRLLPQYTTDESTGTDRLDRDSEAAALAELITARSAQAPMAIGIFGDWAEGKSFFLDRLANFVEEKSSSVNDNDPIAYHSVRQVPFNAWHYAETDLWASLIVTLFDKLSDPTNPRQSQREQSRLTAELAERRHLLERLDAVRQRKEAIQRKLTDRSLWDSLNEDEKQIMKEALGSPGYNRVDTFYESINFGATRAKRQLTVAWWALRWARWWLLVPLALAVAIVIVGVVAWPDVQSAYRYLLSVSALLVGGASVVAVTWKKINKGVQRAEALQKVEGYGQSEKVSLQTAFVTATAEEESLEEEVRNSTPAGQLAGFIQKRSVGDTYRSKLGIMTQIHQDLETMTTLLRVGANQPYNQDLVGDTLPRVDRIVLYIDDLDRSPPERVVEVLEAIHLLLAMPLFVVVVAVDPRWLLSSLTNHYQGIFTANTDSAEEVWSSTPMQYLEKIFQIPFTLAPVATDGYQRLVDSLTASRRDTLAPTLAEGVTISRTETGRAPSTRATNRRGWRSVVSQLPRVDERADPLAFTEDEQRLLSLLGPPLITTPRSIKRLVNSYGLLNALHNDQRPLTLSEHIDSETGASWYPFRAALVLLAILIGAPAESPELFTQVHEMAQSDPKATWKMLLERIESTVEETPNGRDCLVVSAASRTERWQEVIQAVRNIGVRAEHQGLALPVSLRAWAAWIVPVGRLSFETGRNVLRLAETDIKESRRRD